MKRYTIGFILLLAMTPWASASSIRANLTDSLNRFAAQYARVGTITVKRITTRDYRTEVYVSPQLSCIPFSTETVDSLHAMTARVLGLGTNQRVLVFTDGYEVSELVSSFRGGQRNQYFHLDEVIPLTQNTSRPYDIEQGLSGKHIALYGSHGRYFYQGSEEWTWQRARVMTTVEDVYTTSYTMPFLTPMLENAGAVVIQARERDTQVEEVIVDETQAKGNERWIYEPNGGWTMPYSVLVEGENPFKMGGYLRRNKTSEADSLVYTPQIPKAGEYAVYVSYHSSRNSTTNAQYVVCHKGMRTLYAVNQKMSGSTWVYLGSFAFGEKTDENYVALLTQGPATEMISSDAVRFGGGMGNVARYALDEMLENVPSAVEGGSMAASQRRVISEEERQRGREVGIVSGYPRWLEAARYWMQYSGVPDTIYNYTDSKNDYTDDYASRGRWMNYLAGGSQVNPKAQGLNIPVCMGLAFHTDAGVTNNDTIVGTLMIYRNQDDDRNANYMTGASRILARDYGDYMQTQIVEDIQQTYAPEWPRRMLHNSSYAEARHPKMPTVLLELLSHQNYADMRYGLDPRFRFLVSRAIYKGMLRFQHEQDGTPYVVQPLPVQQFAAHRLGEQAVRLTWQPTTDSLEATAVPTGYILYTRQDERDWDNGRYVDQNSCIVPLDKDVRYDFKVVAVNAGGASFPSEILSAGIPSESKGTVLIINGFNRVSAPAPLAPATETFAGFNPEDYGVPYGKDVCYIGAQHDFNRANMWVSDDNQGFGASHCDYATTVMIGNTFDYPVMHGKALLKAGYAFFSTSAAAIDSTGIDAAYDMVDVIMGKQRTTTLGTQKQVTDFQTFTPTLQAALNGFGGAILVSGAYIGTDMQAAADKAFTKSVLHYEYRTTRATHNGKIRVRRALDAGTMQLVTEPNEKTLPCESADGVQAVGDKAFTFCRYDDTGVAAGVGFDGAKRTMVYGFPLESLTQFEKYYLQSIEWLIKHE